MLFNILNYTSYITIRISGGFSLSLTVQCRSCCPCGGGPRWQRAILISQRSFEGQRKTRPKRRCAKGNTWAKTWANLGFQPSLRCDLFIFVHVDFNGILIGFHRCSMGFSWDFFILLFLNSLLGFFKKRFLFVKTECSDEDLSRPEICGVCPEIWSRNGRFIP